MQSAARKLAEHSGTATIFAYHIEEPASYGVIELDSAGRPLSIEEKPAVPRSNWAVTELYFYDHRIAGMAPTVRPSPRGEMEFTDINRLYLQDASLHVVTLGRGHAWLDTGTHDDLLEASEFVRTIQRRQGTQIACLEEIAWTAGWLDDAALCRRAELCGQSSYGQYLIGLAGQSAARGDNRCMVKAANLTKRRDSAGCRWLSCNAVYSLYKTDPIHQAAPSKSSVFSIRNHIMRITMIGSGYVGLVSGACFADFGHDVKCIDKDEAKINALLSGRIPIYEPGLDRLVESNAKAGRLSFSTDLAAGVADAHAVFVAVGTPSRRGDGHADLSYVYAAAEEIAHALTGFTVIVDKSTVPVGTGDEVERIIRSANPDADFSVVSNPEFLREGAAIEDFKRPDRVVIGGNDPRALELMREIYRPLALGRSPIIEMSRRGAELTKYAGNAFLATKITFINEIADLCEKVGADVQDVARGIGLDNRIGAKFLHAGPGYGGSCFPKDTLALLKTAQDFEAPQRIVEAVVAVNDNRKRAMGRKVIHAIGGDARGKIIAILGLTFKPNTDDMRDSPAIAIIQTLQDAGAIVRAHDPEGNDQARKVLHNVDYRDDPYETMDNADALVIVTEWDAFRALDLKRARSLLKAPVLIDLRNIYPRESAEKAGLTYHAIGR